MRLDGEHDEGIWIPGVRFEASIDSNRVFADILDRQTGKKFDAMDAGVLRHLVEMTQFLKDLMTTGEKGYYDPQDFRALVSRNHKFADIEYVSGAKFTVLNQENVGELHELSSVVLENLGAKPA